MAALIGIASVLGVYVLAAPLALYYSSDALKACRKQALKAWKQPVTEPLLLL